MFKVCRRYGALVTQTVIWGFAKMIKLQKQKKPTESTIFNKSFDML